MTLSQANRERPRSNSPPPIPVPDDMIEKLPQQLQDLITRSMNLQSRVRRLDITIHTPPADRAPIAIRWCRSSTA